MIQQTRRLLIKLINRMIGLTFIVLSIITFTLPQAAAQTPETPQFGNQAVTGGLSVADYLEWEDLGTLPAASGYTEGQTVRVGSSVYMLYSGAWVEWIDFASGGSSGSGSTGTAASTIYVVTDTLTVSATSYTFLLGVTGKRFVEGYPQIFIDDVNVTPHGRNLPGMELNADGQTDHRGFDIRFSNPIQYARTVRIYYALEDFTGIDFVTDSSGGGLALPSDISINTLAGLRR